MKLRHSAITQTALLVVGWVFAARAQTGWKTYRDPAYGFSIRYPASMTYYPGHPDLQEAQLSMVPICDDTTVACFEYNGHDGNGANLQAAGLSVNVLREKETADDCGIVNTGSYPIKKKTINGTEFRFGETGEVAAGSSAGGATFRTFRQGVCFEIAVHTAWTDAWEPENGPKLSAAREKAIEAGLNAMLNTFRFVGPVRDGAAWRQYDDSSCASLFEYPEGSEVRVDVPFSPASNRSTGVTCSESFTRNSRKYTISAKADLRSRDAADAWLQTSGYPGLNGAKLLSQSKNCTVYRASAYHYVYLQSESMVYILFVSDAEHRAVAPDGDAIFAHLLDSFKVH